MGQVEFKNYTQIRQRMINRVVARSELTDLLESSSVYKVLDAASREDDDQYFQMRKVLDMVDIYKVYGRDLDDLAAKINPDIISRRLGQAATGTVVFSRTSTVGDKTITVGTRLKTADGKLFFTTTTEGTILNGNTDSNNVSIKADDTGSDYNVDPNTIIAFVNKPSGVDSVSNPAALTNGVDVESDDRYVSRIRLYLQSLSRATIYSLISAALNAEDSITGKSVQFAEILEIIETPGKAYLYIDDGSGTIETGEVSTVVGQTILASAQGGEVDLYLPFFPVKAENSYTIYVNASPLTEGIDYTLNPADGHIKLTTALTALDAVTGDWSYWTGLIAEVQKIIDGDAADRVNYPGYRAAGTSIRVLPPEVVQQIFTANITVLDGYDQTSVIVDVKNAVNNYYNSRALGEDIVFNELVERCMATLGVYDIEITSPSENQIILASQLARIIDSNISIS